MKNVLITGCSTGIGYFCAKELNKDDRFNVIATCRKQKDVDRLNSEGIKCYLLDLDSSESIKNSLKIILQEHKTIYALFNNGAYGQPGAVEDLKREVLKEQFETNVFGTHELTTLILPIMRKQNEGKIIQNSSILGFVSFRYRGAYNASKYALESLSDTLRLELRDTNIKISIIEPGPITSNFRLNARDKFFKNIDYDNSIHHKVYQKMKIRFNSNQKDPFTLGEVAVYKVFLKALLAKNPKIRYRVTFPTTLFWFLKRVVSSKILDWFICKAT